jgi:hypothetical protein
MPVRVQVFLWDPQIPGMPLNEVDWNMAELPNVGEYYWHGRNGYRVKARDDSTNPPRLDLEQDREYEERLSGVLPDEYFVDGGRRDDGSWHFQVSGPRGFVPGNAWSIGDDMAQTIREAVAGALQALNVER